MRGLVARDRTAAAEGCSGVSESRCAPLLLLPLFLLLCLSSSSSWLTLRLDDLLDRSALPNRVGVRLPNCTSEPSLSESLIVAAEGQSRQTRAQRSGCEMHCARCSGHDGASLRAALRPRVWLCSTLLLLTQARTTGTVVGVTVPLVSSLRIVAPLCADRLE